MDEWVSEWVSTCRGEGRRRCDVRPPRLAPHEKLWISLSFGVERCETVIVIIMEIIMMMIIIMMVIKRKKNLLQMLHFYHARWHSLIVAPRALDGGGWHLPRILVQVSGLTVSGDKGPSSSRKLMPLVSLSVHFHLSKYAQEHCLLLFSCLELLHWHTLTLQHSN